LFWACIENARKEIYTKSIIYEFGDKRPRDKPRNRWQDEMRED
jgi:hypothetical protein